MQPEGASITKVLVVDDEIENLRTFERAFRKDFVIKTVTSGVDAMRLLQAEEFDVLISDYLMPGMTGVELVTLVSRSFPNVGRLILTAHSDLQEVRDTRRNSLVAAVLPKPWDRAEVLRWVQHLQRLGNMRASVQKLKTSTNEGDD